MHCERARELISPYIDGELAGAERQAVVEHTQSCKACAAIAQDMRRLSRQIAAAGREPAPKALVPRIRAELAAEPVQAPIVPASIARAWGTRFARQAAILAAVCVVSSLATWLAIGWPGNDTRIESEIVSAHIRSLLQDTPVQVASSEQHTVKPWFAGRIDFAPEVKDLSAEGFPLAGARLDYIDSKRVGALVYRRRLHVVNVFMWPATTAEPMAPRQSVFKGYNLVSWSKGGVTYQAVSDLNAGELRQLQSLL